VAATPPTPAPEPAQQPAPKSAEPKGGVPAEKIFPGGLDRTITAQIPPDQLFGQLERDTSHYPIRLTCWAADRCAATIVPNVHGTQWQARANMSEQAFQDFDKKYTALGYRVASHQFYFDANQVQFHQAVWLKD
jgi:hypothetical protein